jgi:hypothetical protein
MSATASTALAVAPQTSPVTALQPRGRDEHWLSVTQPTAATRFLRIFLPWQLVRFVVINLKMIRIISMSHRQHHRRD